MRFLNLFLALAALLIMCVSAVPMVNNDNTLPIPDPKSATYETDLALVVDYARNLSTSSAPAGDKQCGVFIDWIEHTNIPTYASAQQVCRDTAPAQQMQDFMNWHCGFCIVFDNRGCQGAVKWSGGPIPLGPGDHHDVRGAESYFCY